VELWKLHLNFRLYFLKKNYWRIYLLKISSICEGHLISMDMPLRDEEGYYAILTAPYHHHVPFPTPQIAHIHDILLTKVMAIGRTLLSIRCLRAKLDGMATI
jgi:hypothetical protein